MEYHLKIKSLRNALKLSQRKFAEDAGLTRGTISQIELGNQKPTLEIIQAIAIYYNISFDYFFSDLGAEEAIKGANYYRNTILPSVIDEPPPEYNCQKCKLKDEQIEYLKKLIAYQEKDIEEMKVKTSGGQKRKAG